MLTQSPMFLQSAGVYGGGAQLFSYVQLFATPWTVAYQAPLSTGLSRQEYRSRLPLNLYFLCLLNWQADFLPLCQLGNLFAWICVGIYIYIHTHIHICIYIYIWMKVKVAQSCLWLFVTPWTGILQARILEWVGVPFSRGSSKPRDRTQVSHITGGFFTSWATGEYILIYFVQQECLVIVLITYFYFYSFNKLF